ncbi:aKG-HExxH-type peptide beta-hydroxylase [Bacillus cereus group sp. MYBK5-2]|uniref:aKG-HExxH-type peptide beta-hydroxylase n=1 Tax=Bacillus cereus group sp. MYBK5-2 TaxID=3450622 RepID=UPI003F7AC3DD
MFANEWLIESSPPWKWRFCENRWFEQLQPLVENWTPCPELQIDTDFIKASLTDAIQSNQRWIVHPCISAITLKTDKRKLQRDFQLALWVMTNISRPYGTVSVPEPIWAWFPDGGFMLSPDRYSWSEIVTNKNLDIPFQNITIDPWSNSLGIRLASPSASEGYIHLPTMNHNRVEKDVMLLLRSLALLNHYMPDCMTWITSVTRAIIVFPSIPNIHQSWSRKDTPGVIYMTAPQSVLEGLEAIVHESAHRHLFLAETYGPLVQPGDSAIYKSPLRRDPRPLRGILLACHAIAYMYAFYSQAFSLGLDEDGTCESRINLLKAQYNDSLAILNEAEHKLTTKGKIFLKYTDEVVQNVS